MSWQYANRVRWTCDTRGCRTEEVTFDTRPPKGWVEVPVYLGPELQGIGHHCPKCVPPEQPK